MHSLPAVTQDKTVRDIYLDLGYAISPIGPVPYLISNPAARLFPAELDLSSQGHNLGIWIYSPGS